MKIIIATFLDNDKSFKIIIKCNNSKINSIIFKLVRTPITIKNLYLFCKLKAFKVGFLIAKNIRFIYIFILKVGCKFV